MLILIVLRTHFREEARAAQESSSYFVIVPDSSNEYALDLSRAYVRYAQEAEYPLKKLGIKVFVVNGKSYQLW